MDENSGYVYAVVNPSLEGLVRIEVTKGEPQNAAKDLAIASGAAAPFIVIFQQWFQDCSAAIELVQNRLADHRSADKDGYYSISNTEAVRAILETRNRLEISKGQGEGETSTLEDTAKRNRRKFCAILLEEGRRLQYGDSSMPRDEDEAIKVYEKAINMNCHDANRLLGTLYYERFASQSSSTLDLEKALKHFEAGIAKGNTRCWGDAASCYEKLEKNRIAEICWGNFWSQKKEKMQELDEHSLNLYTVRFQEYMNSPARLEYRKLTIRVAKNVGETYAELPEGKNELQYKALFGVDYPG